MSALSVTTTPVLVPEAWRDLQNLGTADIYLGNDNTVSSSTGVKVIPNGVYNRPHPPAYSIWAIAASGTQDVRLIA